MMMTMMIPIVVTPVGMVTAARLVQYWKVLAPNNHHHDDDDDDDSDDDGDGDIDNDDPDRGDSSWNYNRR